MMAKIATDKLNTVTFSDISTALPILPDVLQCLKLQGTACVAAPPPPRKNFIVWDR